MPVLEDMDAKLDVMMQVLTEEVNIHPDLLRNGSYQEVPLPLTDNYSVLLHAKFDVFTGENGSRYLRFQLRDPYVYGSRYTAFHTRYMTCIPSQIIDTPSG